MDEYIQVVEKMIFIKFHDYIIWFESKVQKNNSRNI